MRMLIGASSGPAKKHQLAETRAQVTFRRNLRGRFRIHHAHFVGGLGEVRERLIARGRSTARPSARVRLRRRAERTKWQLEERQCEGSSWQEKPKSFRPALEFCPLWSFESFRIEERRSLKRDLRTFSSRAWPDSHATPCPHETPGSDSIFPIPMRTTRPNSRDDDNEGRE